MGISYPSRSYRFLHVPLILPLKIPHLVHAAYLCFVRFSEQAAIISLHKIKWLVFRRVRKIPKSDYWLRHVCPSGTTQLPLDGLSWNLILSTFWNSVEKIHVSLKSDKNNGYTLHEDLRKSMISRGIILIMGNVSDKSCRENQNKYFRFNIFFLRKSCRLWDNAEKCRTARETTKDNATRRMHFACWLTTVTNTHSEYVVLTVFPRQPRLNERASMLRYTLLAWLVIT